MTLRFSLAALARRRLRPAGRAGPGALLEEPGRAPLGRHPGGLARRLAARQRRLRPTAPSSPSSATPATRSTRRRACARITDYNGVNGFGRKPDIVTMNNAHATHFTDEPEDGITYVLRGWPSQPGETEAKHDVTLKDMQGVERADQRPRLGRRIGAHQRQLDLHLRHRRSLHRPSRPPAPSADQGPSRRARPHRRADGADRRLLHHGHAADGRRHRQIQPKSCCPCTTGAAASSTRFQG